MSSLYYVFVMSIIPLGTQTLGEEYCDIAQINVHSQTYPGLLVRIKCIDIGKQGGLEVILIDPFP